MRSLLQVGLVGLACFGLAGLAVFALTDPTMSKALEKAIRSNPACEPSVAPVSIEARPDAPSRSDPSVPLFSDEGFENAGFGTACRFTGPIQDRSSLDQVRDAIRVRAKRGIAEQLEILRSTDSGSSEGRLRAFRSKVTIGYLHMYEGNFVEAASWVEKAREGSAGLPRELRANLGAMLGTIHLRRGETENCLECLGPSSCIFPLSTEALHLRPSGSREAIRYYTAYLEERPEDLGVRWLLNFAYMTIGEYPKKVPPKYLIPIEPFRSKLDIGRFENIASRVGLGTRGANMSGGSVFDDFTGDGLPDIFVSSSDVDLGASLFVNRGDGTFEDRSEAANLASQPLGINATQADFDNDGRLDVLMVRGGWENPYRMSLLRNKGGGVFEDVTVAAGLADPIAADTASWGNFNNDGLVDLFVCGEFATESSEGLSTAAGDFSLSDPRNRCRLYQNRGDGIFVNVAEWAGVCNDRYAMGATWGDYDDDGLLDLYVSNFGADNRLYRNLGDGKFEDVAARLGVSEPQYSYSCWFWDYDNDGRFDLFVVDYVGDVGDVVASALGRRPSVTSHPRLYRNLGPGGFRDVSGEVGLDRIALGMGSSYGDIDNDGFLDFYLGTGRPGYSALMPNLMFKNVNGRRFEDITASSGTGHLQKGHGVSFADWDCDGDLDLLVAVGGAVPGDRAYNVLFQNPGNGRHWLKLKLVGARTNRAALGAKIRADVVGPDGSVRSIHRRIGGGSSYGGSSLVESIGLGEATSVATLTVTWPASHSTQVFHDLRADRDFEITEGVDSFRMLPAKRPSLPPR
ncbi:MAG: hypothetical protein JWN86_235 [Planctomycetota bacterium]|nr:hypothetical protein [Planctomycetota bacterium]